MTGIVGKALPARDDDPAGRVVEDDVSDGEDHEENKVAHHSAAFVVVNDGARKQLLRLAFFFFLLADPFAAGVFLELGFQLAQIFSTVRTFSGLAADIASAVEARLKFADSQRL